MTQDEIIEMYLQVSKELCNDTEWCWAGVGEPLQMFAKLVAAKGLAQQEQEYDNSAVHLAHCYQGEYPVCKYGDENCPAIPKVKAQPEQEPPLSAKQAYAMAQVCLDLHDALGCKWGDNPYLTISQLKASQQQRTWVGLSDEEFDELDKEDLSLREFVQAIDDRLKQKNG